MTLANRFTLGRIVMVPFFLVFLLVPIPYGRIIATAIFIAAAVTDFVDGYLARKTNTVTKLGQFLDPLADKALVSSALIALVELGYLGTWAAVILIVREMAVTGLRAIAATEGVVIAAGPWGKAKTVSQIVYITAALVSQALDQQLWMHHLADRVAVPALWTSVALAIWSAVDYGLAYMRSRSA